MDSAAAWFLMLFFTSIAALCAGGWLGRHRNRLSRRVAIGAVAVNVLVIYLMRTGRLYGLVWDDVLVHLEGVAGIPLAMLVLGVLWHHCRRVRERWMVSCAGILAALLFLHGAGWMVQATPSAALASTTSTAEVYQTTDFTCVPASCATALSRLGVETSEARMAVLTQARPGSGSTAGRALRGMNVELKGTGQRAHLIKPTYDDLLQSAAPALVIMRNAPTGVGTTHMVVLLEVHPQWCQVFDPMVGPHVMTREAFLSEFGGVAIVVTPVRLASR